MEDRKYPIELEVITPLSVGAGNDNEWIKGIDFVQKDGKVYVIDMQKVAAAGIDVGALTTLFLKSDDRGIIQLLGNKIDELSRYVFDLPAKTDNNIKTFLRTQFYDRPLVAGSSIKGAIRSALFKYLRTNEEKNEKVFGAMRDGTDFMRFIRIADVEMPSTVLVNTKIFNLRGSGSDWQGGWKHRGTDKYGDSHTDGHYNPVGFNTLYECVAPGNKGLGNITLAANAFSLLEKCGQSKSPYAGKKRTILNEPISSLFQVINDVTKEYLQKERAFFLKYDADRSDEVLSCIDSLLSMIPTDDSSCLLKMSAGVGFHSITGDWQYDDYDNTGFRTDYPHAGKKKYKSRKIAEYNGHLQLMGFVKLKALTTDEAFHYSQSLDSEHAKIIANTLAAANLRESERQQRMEEARLRQLAIEEKAKKQEAFEKLLNLAQKLFEESQWEEAITKANEALEIYPNDDMAASLLEKIQKAKNTDDFLKRSQEESDKKFSQPLAEVIKGKTSAGNLVGTTVKWLKAEGHVFGQKEHDDFLAEARKLPSKELKKIKGKLSDLAKIAGKEKTDNLINKLGL